MPAYDKAVYGNVAALEIGLAKIRKSMPSFLRLVDDAGRHTRFEAREICPDEARRNAGLFSMWDGRAKQALRLPPLFCCQTGGVADFAFEPDRLFVGPRASCPLFQGWVGHGGPRKIVPSVPSPVSNPEKGAHFTLGTTNVIDSNEQPGMVGDTIGAPAA